MKGPTPTGMDPIGPDRAIVADASPSKAPKRRKTGRESGAVDIPQTTEVHMMDGAVGPAAAAEGSSGGGTAVASSPPGQQALKEAAPQMEQQASLPPGVPVGSI